MEFLKCGCRPLEVAETLSGDFPGQNESQNNTRMLCLFQCVDICTDDAKVIWVKRLVHQKESWQLHQIYQ